MKLLNAMATAAVAVVSISVPALARVDSGTPRLLQTLQDYGVTVRYNPTECDSGEFHGLYHIKREMILCYDVPNANAHNTVRHETFHALQHCAALRRGDNRGIVPLAINHDERHEFVTSVLSTGDITKIKSLYKPAHYQIELEAFAAAEHYSADELASLVKSWCWKRN